jgi:hypothetical protein
VLDPSRLSDLRVALHTLGAARLRDVAALDLGEAFRDRATLPLPVRHGLEETDDGARARRRHVSRQALEPVAAAALRFARRAERWPRDAPLGEHLARTGSALSEDLGWRGDPERDVRAILADLVEECGSGLQVDLPEWVLLVEQALAAASAAPIGGAGGGVQVLDATEARGRTFSQLFLLGLNRDTFPRAIEEDPLLPDASRRRLAEVLPQIPIKESGFDEERFLFAELLSSSPRVTLSWQSCDDDGRARTPSPLVVRLRLGRPDLELVDAPSLHAPPDGVKGAKLARPAHEHALIAGLYGSRRELRDRLPLALGEVRERRAGDLAREADARVALLDELDPDLRTREGRQRRRSLGPYFGFVGASVDPADPRRSPLYATTAEGMAGCPWRTLLTRLLRIESPPDALDALPSLDRVLIGATVHRALEWIARDAVPAQPEGLDAAAAAEAVELDWPSTAELERRVAEAAERTLREAGLALPGLARALALRARPYLETARHRGRASDAGPTLLGAELAGRVNVEGLDLELGFRADRVERAGPRLVLTDFKTGRPISDGLRRETRRRNLLEKLLHGSALQIAAYAFSEVAPETEGRYVYLDPEIDEELAIAAVAGDDSEARACFERALDRVLGAWRSGSFFPRVVEARGGGNADCDRCRVRPACLRDDSGARARLEGWVSERHDAGSAAERALLDLWRLPLERPGAQA